MRRLFLLLLVLCLPLGCVDEQLTDISHTRTTTIHVSTWGTMLGDGSAKRPAPSLERGYQLAIAAGADTIRLGFGDYHDAEDFRLYGGIHLIGGCDPITWQPDPDAMTRFTRAINGVQVSDIQVPTTIRNLEFQLLRPSQWSYHAVALKVVHCSADLHFIRCRFTAANVVLSGNLPQPEPPQDQLFPTESGREPVCGTATPGLGGVNDSYQTGDGGDGGMPGAAGQDGQPGIGTLGGAAGAGGAPGLDGQDGADGLDGPDGENGKYGDPLPTMSAFSLVWATGQRPSSGVSGGPGGGGGGGGGGSATGGNGGGSGGTRGSGGNRGNNGANGPCSIGALIQDSAARFTECHFQAGHAGDAQDGVDGTPGAAGSPGGSGADACQPDVGRGGNGGHGGHGGCGGGSAGGHGGHSIALWIVGDLEPTFNEPCTRVFGQAGRGGMGGQHGNGLSRGPRGQDGLACKILRTAGFSSMDPPESR